MPASALDTGDEQNVTILKEVAILWGKNNEINEFKRSCWIYKGYQTMTTCGSGKVSQRKWKLR